MAARGRSLMRTDPREVADGRDVWVVLPTYNEAENVERAVGALVDVLRCQGRGRFGVLIVDDASPDGTGEIADRLAAAHPAVRVLHRSRREGLAEAYLAGFAHVLAHGADVVVQMDCDLSHDPAVISRMLAALDAGADVVIGSRYVAGGGAEWTAGRRLLSDLGSRYARRLLGLHVRDLTGGFKCFRREVLEAIELASVRSRGFGFQIETTYRAVRKGFRVVEIPIRFRDRRDGASKMSWRIALEAAGMVPRLRLGRVRRRPPRGGPLRILMLTRGVVPLGPDVGGAELAAHQLSRALAAEGHAVSLVTDFEDTDVDEFPTLELFALDSRLTRWAARVPGAFPGWLGRHVAGNLAVALRARRLLRERPYDLVHAHGALSAILVSLCSRASVVYTEHDAPPWLCRYRSWGERLVRRAVYRVLNVAAFKRADRVGATFASLREDMINRFGVRARKVMTIGNGTDARVFTVREVTPPEQCLDAALRDGGEPVPFDRFCLFVGRLEPRKCPDLLLRALADVPDANCVLVGDGPMRDELERLAVELGVSRRVAFLGRVRSGDLPAIYARAALLVLPSVSEAVPLVAIEAMACGTPVLASRIAGLPTLVRDYENGFLVAPGSPGELSVALRFLMRDPALLRDMSDAAREGVGRRFVWPVVAREYEALYRSLAGGPPPLPRTLGEPAAAVPSPSIVPALPAPEVNAV